MRQVDPIGKSLLAVFCKNTIIYISKRCRIFLRPFAPCARTCLCGGEVQGAFYLLQGGRSHESEIYLSQLWDPLGYDGLCWKCKCEQE